LKIIPKAPVSAGAFYIEKNQGGCMSQKLKRDDYDKLDRALSEVESAEESGRVGAHAILIATLHALGFVVWSVEAAIEKALELLGIGWRNDDE
jgi:hypothetical protein